jgi:hypothetical protein
VIGATVDRHPVELALRGAAVMLDVLEGRLTVADAPDRVRIEPTAVTAVNVDQFVPWDSRCEPPPSGSWDVL